MNISYNWLKDLVEIDLSPQELAQKLTSVGLAVEGIHEFEDDFVFDIDLTSNRPRLSFASRRGARNPRNYGLQNYELRITKTKNRRPKTKIWSRFRMRICVIVLRRELFAM